MVNDVLRAAVDEIARSGYGALRVEDVATRAGVNKTTVYRRWPTKADLAGAAIRASAGYHEPLPDTGTVRGDLVEMVHRALAFASTPEGRAVTRLMTIESSDPEVDHLARSLRDGIMARREEIIQRGQRRGELPMGIDARLLLDAIFVPITSRVLRFGEHVDAPTAEAFVDLILTGVKHGAGRALREAC